MVIDLRHIIPELHTQEKNKIDTLVFMGNFNMNIFRWSYTDYDSNTVSHGENTWDIFTTNASGTSKKFFTLIKSSKNNKKSLPQIMNSGANYFEGDIRFEGTNIITKPDIEQYFKFNFYINIELLSIENCSII